MRKNIYKYIEGTLGMILLAFAFDLVLSPMNIVTGGTGGLAVLTRHLTGLNTSTFVAIFFVAMILLNFIVFKKEETLKMLYFSIMYPIFTKLLEGIPNIIQLDYSNKLLLFLFAAIISGAGNGLIFRNGFITGGTDVIKKILSEKIHVPMGTSTFIIDGLIVLSGGIIFGLESVLYAIIIIYIASKITDRFILGISMNKMFYIMTNEAEVVRNCIKDEFKIGITEIDAVGGYKSKQHILMTVIDTRNYIKLKQRINEIDNNAFMVITDSYHMYYHGW